MATATETIDFPAHLLPELYRLFCLWEEDFKDDEGNPLPGRGELLAWAEQEINKAPYEVEEGLQLWGLFQRHPANRLARLESISNNLSAVLTQEEAETYPALEHLFDLIQDLKKQAAAPSAPWETETRKGEPVVSMSFRQNVPTYKVEIHEVEIRKGEG